MRKSFGISTVLHDVTITLHPGTATALAGENGAGKSTLMKIAAGLEKSDAGTVILNGHELTTADPRAVREWGAAMVPQELAPILDMKVYENIYLGRELTGRNGLLQRALMASRTAELLSEFDVKINPQAYLRDLPVGLRQLVEIVKATSTGATFLMLDEPTSALSERETQRLFVALERLKAKGVALLFTTHRMEEIRQLADRVVVLRDGRLTLDKDIDSITDGEVINAMIGREFESLYPTIAPAGEKKALTIENLQIQGFESAVDLVVHEGEILGLAGMVGAGRTELLEGIFGHRRTVAGTITVGTSPLKRNNVVASISQGVALVPEDRKHAGLVLSMNILDNSSLPGLKRYSTIGFIRNRLRFIQVTEAMEKVRLKATGLRQGIDRLSGGNQQKVVLGRWLTGNVKVLLLDEPTRGVDVGARSEIYRLISQLAASGMAVIMASSDMPEVLSLSHRVAVMKDGAIVGSLTSEELSAENAQERVFHLASGYEE